MKIDTNQLPFSSNESLKKELIDSYLVNAVEWLTGPPTKGKKTLRAVSADNPWETALSITSILNGKKLLQNKHFYRDEYDTAIDEGVEYLIYSVIGDQSSASWDQNPFDTGLAIYALVAYTKESKVSKYDDCIDTKNIIKRGISWIINYAQEWMQDHTIGEIDDISVCIRAIIKAEEAFPEIQYLNQHPELVHTVIKEILTHATKKDSCLHWSDLYSSAYILILLQEYIDVYPEENSQLNIIDNMRYTLNHLEQSFSGNWEQPPDTALTLLSYMKSGIHSSINHDVLPEIVYLCLRWLCDSKQCYSNGSIQRSIHYTSLFVDAIVFACSEAKIDNRVMQNNIAHVNDYVLRQIIQRDKIERTKHTLERIKYEKLENKYKHAVVTIDNAKNLFYSVSSKIIWVLSFIIFLIACYKLSVLEFTTDPPYVKIENKVAASVPVIFLVGGLIYTVTLAITKTFKKIIKNYFSK